MACFKRMPVNRGAVCVQMPSGGHTRGQRASLTILLDLTGRCTEKDAAAGAAHGASAKTAAGPRKASVKNTRPASQRTPAALPGLNRISELDVEREEKAKAKHPRKFTLGGIKCLQTFSKTSVLGTFQK